MHWWSPVLLSTLVLEILAVVAWWSVRRRLRNGLGTVLIWMTAAAVSEVITVMLTFAGRQTWDFSVGYSVLTATVIGHISYRWGARWSALAPVVGVVLALVGLQQFHLPAPASVALISGALMVPLSYLIWSSPDGPTWGVRSLVVFALALQHGPTAVYYPWLTLWGSGAPALLFWTVRCAFIAASYLVLIHAALGLRRFK